MSMTASIRRISEVFVTVVALIASIGVAAASDLPFECTTNGGGKWKIVAHGPTSISCPAPASGACTAMQFAIQPLVGTQPDHVAILAGHDVTIVSTDSRNVAAPCDGDSVTYLGIRDCSMQAVRMNKDAQTGFFELIVTGDAQPIESSVVVKKGKVIEECRIVSLGLDPVVCDPKAQQASKETFTFDDCEVEIALNPCTGEPLTATTVSGNCAVGAVSIDEIKLEINGVLQDVTVGEGWLSSGDDSCTTRWFNRKPYVTCSCTNVSDCLVKTSDNNCLCAGQGVCASFPNNVCLQ
jgi:hypothetical protein